MGRRGIEKERIGRGKREGTYGGRKGEWEPQGGSGGRRKRDKIIYSNDQY